MNLTHNIIIKYRRDGLSYGLIGQLVKLHKAQVRRVVMKHAPDLMETMRVGTKNLKQLPPHIRKERRWETIKKYRKSENYKKYRKAYRLHAKQRKATLTNL